MSEKSNVVDISHESERCSDASKYEVLRDIHVVERRIARKRVADLEMRVDKMHNDFGDLLRMMQAFAEQEDINNGD